MKKIDILVGITFNKYVTYFTVYFAAYVVRFHPDKVWYNLHFCQGNFIY